MKKNKIYSLTLALLLLSACSTKDIKKDTRKEHNRTANKSQVKKQNSLGIDDINYIDKRDSVDIVDTIDAIDSRDSTYRVEDEIDTLEEDRIDRPNIKEDIEEESYNIVEQQAVSYNNELEGEFKGNYKLLEFIDMMVNIHNFERGYLNRIFSEAKNYNLIPEVNDCTSNITFGKIGAWDRYKSCFIYDRNIERGVEFWNEHQDALNRAEAEYGVPAKYIIGILGIETAYGTNFGKYRAIDVLTTRSMLGDRRASFYRDELEKFLLITRDIGLEPTEVMGSVSGALGYGQFMPSSYIRFAVDFNSDGKRDLWDAEDAIGSIANYFARNGWDSSIPKVAVRAKYRGSRFRRLKTGYKTKYSLYRLKKRYHIYPRERFHPHGAVSLIKLPRATYDELWLGSPNFRVITTYNHSAYYGMAVYKLGELVDSRRRLLLKH